MQKVIVDQTEVKNALRAGIKPYTIAKKLNFPISVINDIKNGKDRPSFFRKPLKDKKNIVHVVVLEKRCLVQDVYALYALQTIAKNRVLMSILFHCKKP